MEENQVCKCSPLKNILWKLFRIETEKQEVPESTTEKMKHLVKHIEQGDYHEKTQ